jgi:hypothetical protein
MPARCLISAVAVSLASLTPLLSAAGCAFNSEGLSDEGPVAVRGRIVDFQTRASITASSVVVSGLIPAPSVALGDGGFTIESIPQSSAFGVLATAAMYRPTYTQIEVGATGLDGLEVAVVGEAFIAGLAGAFGASPSPTAGIVLLHLVDAAGAPRPGVAATDLSLAGASPPHFLDDKMMPAAAATASSSSGWVVFFNVPPGLIALTQTASAATTIDMPVLPIAAGQVSIVDGSVTVGAPVLPRNVSFQTHIVPIFTARGCGACHSGGGIGKEQGNLTLGGSAKLIYKELVEERPNTRVRLATPETSLVLTMPSREDPPDRHPNVTFAGPRDPDYLKLLVWIREGARDN